MKASRDVSYPPEYEREWFVHDALSVAGSDEAMGAALEAFFDRHEGALDVASGVISTAFFNYLISRMKRTGAANEPPPF